jgi:hypothetical protein
MINMLDNKYSSHNQQQLVLLSIFAIIGIVVWFMFTTITYTSANAQNNGSNNLNLFSIDSKPYNLTYGEWSAKWWQWVVAIPKESNPLTDNTGKNCAINQNGPVWFLAGTTGGSVTRQCTVPAGKAILVPIINFECSFVEYPNLKSESELRTCAKSQTDQVTSLQASIDGINLQNPSNYRVQSPIFIWNIPKDNVYEAPSGATKSVADGYWIFLQPLKSGKHDIHVSGISGQFTASSVQNFGVDITYHMIVQ